ncbi:MAG: LuxR C-terminal-related transcriptional regulator, partial [Burkholderiales bacterium]
NELMRRSVSGSNAVSLLRAWFLGDVRRDAPRVRCPALVLHARSDLRIPFEEGRALAALIPGARFVPLDNRNHFLLEHEPAWRQLVTELEAFLPAQSAAPGGSIDGLTAREHAVLEVLAKGMDTEAMAERLGMSEKTVRNHLSTIFSKLGVANRAQAPARAREAGIGGGFTS